MLFVRRLTVFLLLFIAAPFQSWAELPPTSLSGPYTSDNLTIFLVHGSDQLDTTDFLSLSEGLDTGVVIVHETGDVNNLSVENRSKDKTIYIQAGEIVKGGKQDRVFSDDLILRPGSGEVQIGANCVERGRWHARGEEEVGAFRSSDKYLASKALQIANRGDKDQAKVWEGVGRIQNELSTKLGKSVKAGNSESSLQLSLEHDEVEKSVGSLTKSLRKIPEAQKDTIGHVILINGQIATADIYASHALYLKLWPKLLDAAATEATAQKGDMPFGLPTRDQVLAFLAVKNAPREERVLSAHTTVKVAESKQMLQFETVEKNGDNAVIRKSYIAK